MSGPRRALCAWDMQSLTEGHLAALKALEGEFEELVVAITRADEAFTPAQPLLGGQRVARATRCLRQRLERPFFVLPIKDAGLTAPQRAIRLAIDTPAFDTFVTDEAPLALAMEALCGKTTRPLVASGACVLEGFPEPSRGLFIARAQPFHIGHEAFVAQIAAERGEVIVLLAMANASHTLMNPATAGERLEMVRPVLERVAPGRHHLAAAPYVDHDAANVPELRLLLPAFSHIYTNSPSTRALATSAGVPCVSLGAHVEVSGTQIRRRVLAGEDCGDLVPDEVAEVLGRSPFAARLRALAEAEARGQGGA